MLVCDNSNKGEKVPLLVEMNNGENWMEAH